MNKPQNRSQSGNEKLSQTSHKKIDNKSVVLWIANICDFHIEPQMFTTIHITYHNQLIIKLSTRCKRQFCVIWFVPVLSLSIKVQCDGKIKFSLKSLTYQTLIFWIIRHFGLIRKYTFIMTQVWMCVGCSKLVIFLYLSVDTRTF